jgi:hypothetical protein
MYDLGCQRVVGVSTMKASITKLELITGVAVADGAGIAVENT